MNYKHFDITFKSSFNDKKIIGELFVPEKDIKGIVHVVHGMCDHLGRYSEFMKYLATSGYVAVGADMLGHGKTAGSPENLGFFAIDNGYRYLIRDVHRLKSIVNKKFPNVPYFLMGHSMGSFVTRLYVSSYHNSVDGLILSGTADREKMLNTGISMLNKHLLRHGPYFRNKEVDAFVSAVNNRKFVPPTETPRDWVVSERGEIKKYVNDPLCNFVFTTSAFIDLFKLHNHCNNDQWYESFPKDLPVLMFSGSKDPIGNFGKGVSNIYRKLVDYDVDDVTLLLYPDGRHEMLHERDKYKVFMDIRKWLSETKELYHI